MAVFRFAPIAARAAALHTAVTATACSGRPAPAGRAEIAGVPAAVPAEVSLPAQVLARPDLGPRGVLHVVVRALLDPSRPVEAAEVRVRPAGTAAAEAIWSSPPRMTDAHGRARRDSLPPGTYEVVVRRVGYYALAARVRLHAGCPTWLELYLGQQVCDIGACPPQPVPRATVTTCVPAT